MKKSIFLFLSAGILVSCSSVNKTGALNLKQASLTNLSEYNKTMQPHVYNNFDKNQILKRVLKISQKLFSKGVYHETALNCLQKDSNSCLALAQALDTGNNVKRIPKYAFELAKFSCAMDNVKACQFVLDYYLNNKVKMHYGWVDRLSNYTCEHGYKQSCKFSK